MSRRRAQAFGRMKALVLRWAASESLSDWHCVTVRAYGSYEMGVDNDASDIDCCVWVDRRADPRLTKDLFFERFPLWLENSSSGISPPKIIAASKVPLISVVIDGVEFEICFYREGDDNDGIFSKLAVETTTAILAAVPDVTKFVHNVRQVKQWAQDQGIYNSKLGYLGGIHIAVMVAVMVAAMGDVATGDCCVTQFCKFYGTEWKWPTPVKLTPYYWKGPHENLVWNPVNVPAHRKHLMPVLTPVYPFTNITYATTRSTFSKMMACFAARCGAAGCLAAPPAFTYRIVISENSDGLIESRIYRLVDRLEELGNGVQVVLDSRSKNVGETRQWSLNIAANAQEEPVSTAFFESAVSWWKKIVLDKCAVAATGFASGDMSLQVTLQRCCVKNKGLLRCCI